VISRKPVSPEQLAYFKEGLECWNRDELDLMQDMYAEDGVFDVSAVFPDVAPMRGHRDMRRYWEALRETWDGIRQDPIDAFDLGDGRYVVEVRMSGKGRRSGVEVDQRFAVLYVLDPEDQKVARAQLFPDVAAAISVARSSR
jgi:ketosteroid isomerase-like protein